MAEMKVCVAIIARADAAPVLEAAEHDLDLMASAVERGIVRYGDLTSSRGR